MTINLKDENLSIWCFQLFAIDWIQAIKRFEAFEFDILSLEVYMAFDLGAACKVYYNEAVAKLLEHYFGVVPVLSSFG